MNLFLITIFQGNGFFKQQNFVKAAELYSASIASKEDAVTYCNRAAAYLKLNKFAEAELDCDKAIALDYTAVKAYGRRGIARRELHKYELALQGTGVFYFNIFKDLERSLSLQPQNKDAQKELDITKQAYAKYKLQQQQQSNDKKKKLVVEDVNNDDDDVLEIVTAEAAQIRGLEKKNVPEKKSQPEPAKQVPQQTKPKQQEPAKPKTEPPKEQPKAVPPKQQPAVPPQQQEPAKQAATTTSAQAPVQPAKSPSPPKKQPLNTAPIPTVTVQTPKQAPKSAYEFERYMKELKGDDFYSYLRLIPPNTYKQLFKDSFTPELFNTIIHAVAHGYVRFVA